LREDNADLRLRELAHRLGIVDDAAWERTRVKRETIESAIARLESTTATPSEALNARLTALGTTPLRLPCSFAQLLRRPELDLAAVWSLLDDPDSPLPDPRAASQIEVMIKYAGYVDRQHDAIRRAARMEDARIPPTLDYEAIPGLSREVRDRL